MKKMILLYVLLILMSLAGCRAYRSASSEVKGLASEARSIVSGAAPKLVSDGKLLQSQVSGVVSDVVSKLA